MEYKELLQLYNELVALAETSTEDAQKLIQERFAELPEDVQGELLARMYFKALEDTVEQVQVLGHVQEKGLEALEQMEVLKKKLESERGSADG